MIMNPAVMGVGRADQTGGHHFYRNPGFPWWTLSCCTATRLRFTIGAGQITIRGPALILIRPRTPYTVAGTGKPWREVWAFLAPPVEWRERLDWPNLLPGLAVLRCHGPAGREARRAMRDVHRFATSPLHGREQLTTHAIERLLLVAEQLKPKASERYHPVVMSALECIERDPSAITSVAMLARAVRSSPSHLTALFRQALGCPPMRHRERVQMEHAKRLLLSTGLPIKTIAEAVGFINPFHFSTRFRAVVGRSPRAFRGAPGQ